MKSTYDTNDEYNLLIKWTLVATDDWSDKKLIEFSKNELEPKYDDVIT